MAFGYGAYSNSRRELNIRLAKPQGLRESECLVRQLYSALLGCACIGDIGGDLYDFKHKMSSGRLETLKFVWMDSRVHKTD